jgi:hypothetical protein
MEIEEISILTSSFVPYRKQQQRLYCAGIAVHVVLSRIFCSPAAAGSLVRDIQLMKIFSLMQTEASSFSHKYHLYVSVIVYLLGFCAVIKL